MKNLFSKKLLISASIFLLSTNLYSAPKLSGYVNVDTTPFKIILDKYYDVCDYESSRVQRIKEQKSIDAVKPLLFAPSDKNASWVIGRGISSVLGIQRSTVKGEKPDLTKIRKVDAVYYNSIQKSYEVEYYYYKAQEETKSSFIEKFRPIKDSNGKIVLKLL